MRLGIMLVLLLLAGSSIATQPDQLTASQQGTLAELLHGDLLSFLGGGKSLLAEDWAGVAVPWQRDQQIAIKYSRNAIDADVEMADKEVFIDGRFAGAENWVDGSYRVQMQMVAAILPKENAAFLQGLAVGDGLKIACHAQGLELGTVYMVDCDQPRFATAGLVAREKEKILSSNDQLATRLKTIARIADSKIDPDDPCRNIWGGCLGQMQDTLFK